MSTGWTDLEEVARAIGHEAALFEGESDLAGFLGRAASILVEAGVARRCAVYLVSDGGLVLRAQEGEPSDLPATIDADHPIAAAIRERQAVHATAGGGLSRLVLPIARGPHRIGALVIDGTGTAALPDEAMMRSVASQLGSVLENAMVLLESRPAGPARGAGPRGRAARTA